MTIKTLTLSRRQAFAGLAAVGAAGAGLAAGTFGRPEPAAAAAPQQGTFIPSHHRIPLGDFTVSTVYDGSVQVPGPHPIFGGNVSAEEVQALAEQNFLPPTKMVIGFTPVVVNTGRELVLFDTGNGANGFAQRPSAGRLSAMLAAAGFAPEQIDIVVLTHFHPDHIGGVMENGAPVFPNARYVAGSVEFDFWMNDDRLSGDTAGNAQLVRNMVGPVTDRTRFIAPGDDVVSGITAVDAMGHTPGHLAFHLESQGKRLMITADTANHFVASLQRPDWHVAFDMDKDKAAAARKRVFGMIAADRIGFTGYHMPFPAVGFVEAQGAGFRYTAASYQFSV